MAFQNLNVYLINLLSVKMDTLAALKAIVAMILINIEETSLLDAIIGSS